MQHIEYAYTRGMDDSEIEKRLRSEHTGVLSLASENNAYAVPLAHYYDGDGLYFRLGRTGESEKWRHIRRTETACYTVYDTRPTPEAEELTSWSINIVGRLVELPKADREAFDAAEINRHFTPIRVFDEPVESIEIVVLELDIETMSGRTTLEGE